MLIELESSGRIRTRARKGLKPAIFEQIKLNAVADLQIDRSGLVLRPLPFDEVLSSSELRCIYSFDGLNIARVVKIIMMVKTAGE